MSTKMPVTADKIRGLAAHGEHSRLDFKREMYDWTKPAMNAELAKDLMAIANELRVGSEPGHILIGVDDDGSIVGVPPSAHLDDAELHQRVKNLLNETPAFSYSVVDVDGSSIGVFEVSGGRRPYFPVKDSGSSLRRRVPLHRNGTTTDTASPLMVIEWSKEDDPEVHHLRLLQTRELEVRAKPKANFAVSSRESGPTSTRIVLVVQNLGQYPFVLSVCRWRLEWKEEFRADINQAIAERELGGDTATNASWRSGPPNEYVPPNGAIDFGGKTIVAPSNTAYADFSWTEAMARQHFTECNIPINGFKSRWASFHFEVPLTSDLGDALAIVSAL